MENLCSEFRHKLARHGQSGINVFIPNKMQKCYILNCQKLNRKFHKNPDFHFDPLLYNILH